MELCLAAGHNPDEPAWRDETEPVSLLDELLRAPDRHPVARIFNALRWRGL
jgi:hypothetical protein